LGPSVVASGREYVLSAVGQEVEGTGPGRAVVLRYSIEADPLESFDVRVWQPADWDAFLAGPLGRAWLGWSCVERREAELPNGRLLLLAGPEIDVMVGLATPMVEVEVTFAAVDGESNVLASPTSTPTAQPANTPVGCPEDAPERIAAFMTFADAIVSVNTPNCLTCSPSAMTEEMLREIASAIRPRRKDHQ
jgi:hypothetical protein